MPTVPKTSKKLDRIIMIVLALALGYFAFDKFVLDPARDAENMQAANSNVDPANINNLGSMFISYSPDLIGVYLKWAPEYENSAISPSRVIAKMATPSLYAGVPDNPTVTRSTPACPRNCN